MLKGVSFAIPAGCITALIGTSGAGKTSLVDLVCALNRPDSGSISVDGVPLDGLDLVSWRRGIGYVPQDMFLLHESVWLNVTLGEEFSDAEVETALRRAGAWEFVSQLPEGVETVVGEGGSRLSGGQRQRISIARALVHDPHLLILDEATSGLDPDTEAMVWNSLLRLARGHHDPGDLPPAAADVGGRSRLPRRGGRSLARWRRRCARGGRSAGVGRSDGSRRLPPDRCDARSPTHHHGAFSVE